MAKIVEVDEAEYNQMVALRQVASKMVSKPESRRLLEQAQKLVNPNAATPMLDQEAAQNAPIKEMEKNLSEQIAALKKEREDEKRKSTLAAIAARQNEAFARLRRAGYTDEGIAAVQKLMETKGLVNVDDGVTLFEKQNPPQAPVSPSGITGQAWNFTDHPADGDKDIAALIANKGDGPLADAAAMRITNATLSELRGARR